MVGRAWLLTAIVGALITGIPVCCPASEITIGLTYEDKAVDCVIKNSRDMSNYCLTIYHEGQPLANQDFTCSLDDIQVYKCSSDGKCTDGDKLDVWLSKGGQKVDCVSPDERKVDDYCLELKLHDSTRPSDFQCKFKEDVVYTCTNFNDCKESSALAERGAVPRSVSQKCSGIPFANMDRHFFGSYSCSSQDSTGAEVSGLHIISICKEESLLRPPKKTEREMKTSRGNLFRQD
nr:uncharacterized protein LOC128699921 isoform X3 [Cherax quadricarinatus]